jgi:hypothetical protein
LAVDTPAGKFNDCFEILTITWEIFLNVEGKS